MEEWVPLDSSTTTGVAFQWSTVGCFSCSVTWGTDYILLVIYRIFTILLSIYNFIQLNFNLNFNILSIPSHRVFRYLLRIMLVVSSFLLIGSLFPHIKEILINKIIIIHESLFSSFSFSSFYFFWIGMVVIITTLLSNTVQILIVISSLLWVSKRVISHLQLFKDVSLTFVAGNCWIVMALLQLKSRFNLLKSCVSTDVEHTVQVFHSWASIKPYR